MIQNNKENTKKNYYRGKHNGRRGDNSSLRHGTTPVNQGNVVVEQNSSTTSSFNKDASQNFNGNNNGNAKNNNYRKNRNNKKPFNNTKWSLYPTESEERKFIRSERGQCKKAIIDLSYLNKVAKTDFKPVCPICTKVIEDSNLAIANSSTGEASHFDCIVTLLAKKEEIGQNEKVIYVGSGDFAVISFTGNYSYPKNVTILRKINYEEFVKDKLSVWRKDLAIVPSFIINVEENTVEMKERLKQEEKSFKNDE